MPHDAMGIPASAPAARSRHVNSMPPAPPAGAQWRRERSQNAARPIDSSVTVQPSGASPQANIFRPLPFEKWPAIWQEQFHKMKKGFFGWTYWNLGADLLAARNGCTSADNEQARARKARGQVMARLLRELGHPAGTHTFWPPYLEMSDDATPQPELFWSGLKLLGCRGVIIFGSRAARALIPRPGLHPLQQLREKSFQVWIMKDLSSIEHDQAHYARMLILLKETLKKFIRN